MEGSFEELLEASLGPCEELQYKMYLDEDELPAPNNGYQKSGQRKTGPAYRRYSKYAKYKRCKEFCDDIPRFWRISIAGKWEKGIFVPIGQHVIRSRRSNFMCYLKKKANRRVRRYALPMRERSSYQKYYDIERKEIFHN